MERIWLRRPMMLAASFAAIMGMTALAGPASGTEAAIDEEPYLEQDQGHPGNWDVSDGTLSLDSEEVLGYAVEVEITADQALKALNFQRAVSDLSGEIEVAMGDRFAFSEFIPGKTELIIHVTETGKSDDALMATVNAADLPGTVRIVADAAYSLKERLEIRANSGYTIDVDMLTGATREADDSKTIDLADCQHITNTQTNGGRLIRWRTGDPRDRVVSDPYNGWTDCTPITQTFCTTGFSVTRFGYEGYVTAGHCAGNDEDSDWYFSQMYAYNMRRAYAAHRYYVEQDDNDADAQMNREVLGGTSLVNNIYLDEENGFRSITSVRAGAPSQGSWLCAKGAAAGAVGIFDWAVNDDTAGYFCGTVVDPTANFKNGDNWAQMTVGITYQNQDRYVTGGASGGPVFSGSRAYGIISTSSSAWYVDACEGLGCYDEFYFMHADEVEDELGLTIITS